MRQLLCLLACLCLCQCTSVASSGASALYNHQSLQKSTQDQYITLRSYQAIDIDSDQYQNANINVSTFNRVVILTGQVAEPWQKVQSEKLIRQKVANIDEFHNWLTVGSKSDQATRLKDSWITTKIRAKLFAQSEFDASQVKVITEQSTVFLLGSLKPKEADIVVAAAAHTDGVQKVVKLFTYLNPSKVPIYS